MSDSFGIIENGVVVNVVRADPAFAASRGWIALPPGVGIGFTKNGDEYTKPETPKPTLTIAEFWDRFTQAELDAILASTNAGVKRLTFQVNTRPTVAMGGSVVSGLLGLYVAQDIITPQRRNEILG